MLLGAWSLGPRLLNIQWDPYEILSDDPMGPRQKMSTESPQNTDDELHNVLRSSMQEQ